MSDQSPVVIDVRGQVCPIPLIYTRKAILKGEKGDEFEVVGDHDNSRHEIPMALDSMKCEIIEVREEGSTWYIHFRI